MKTPKTTVKDRKRIYISHSSGVETRAIIRAVTNMIARSYAPTKIILFGSFARGTPRDGSDIDILIIKNTQQNPRQRWLTIRKIVRPLTGHIPISPLVMTERELKKRIAAGDFFIEEILREGKVLYAA